MNKTEPSLFAKLAIGFLAGTILNGLFGGTVGFILFALLDYEPDYVFLFGLGLGIFYALINGFLGGVQAAALTAVSNRRKWLIYLFAAPIHGYINFLYSTFNDSRAPQLWLLFIPIGLILGLLPIIAVNQLLKTRFGDNA